MRVDHRYRQGRESGDGRADLSYAQTCIEKQRALFTKDQIGDDFFKLLRFVDGEHARPACGRFRTTVHRAEHVLTCHTPAWAAAGTTPGEAAQRAAPQNLRPGDTPQGTTPEASGSLLSPGLSAVGAAPDFVVTGGNEKLSRTACVVAQIAAQLFVPHFIVPHFNASYVG